MKKMSRKKSAYFNFDFDLDGIYACLHIGNNSKFPFACFLLHRRFLQPLDLPLSGIIRITPPPCASAPTSALSTNLYYHNNITS